MPRRLWLLCLSIITAVSVHAESLEHYDELILEQLEAHRPDGFGPPLILGTAQGIVRGDTQITAVVFAFQMGESRDRNHWSYLIVFGYGDPIGPVLVGGGSQHFDSVSIEDRTIVLFGKTYANDDSRCCPSVDASIRYGISQRQLVPLATRHHQSLQPKVDPAGWLAAARAPSASTASEPPR
ncbi:MAG: hypothetical protein AAF680_00070 [Pseudomonadota bacterium]